MTRDSDEVCDHRRERVVSGENRGYAIVACLSLLSLLVMLSLSIVSLSTSLVRSSSAIDHLEIARANARVALYLAISDLQHTMGRDQMVCANAAILETPDDPSTGKIDETGYVNNRHWLGAWKTTFNSKLDGGDPGANDLEWPVVGKKPDLDDSSSIAPYAYRGIYSDLRHTQDILKGGEDGAFAWKEVLRQRWLVSRGDSVDYREELDPKSSSNMLLVGRGTLGNVMSEEKFLRQRVVVPAVEILDESGAVSGKYSYWVTNNNTRAKVVKAEVRQSLGSIVSETEAEVFTNANPAILQSDDAGDSMPFTDFNKGNESIFKKVVSDDTLQLASDVDKDQLKERFFDLTTYAYGMHTNVQYGGFKRDLTPLLFAKKDLRTNEYKPPHSELADYAFNTDYSIIPGERHAVMAPDFNALRHWGLSRYMAGLSSQSIEAQTDFASASGIYVRPSHGWARGKSDGAGFEPSRWGAQAPKVFPVMTEAVWHFGFSYTGDGISTASDLDGDSNLRFHLMPKVVLWNPYNVKMRVKDLSVLMPNVLSRDDDNKTRMDFYIEDVHALTLIDKHDDEGEMLEGGGWEPVSDNGMVYKFQMDNKGSGSDGGYFTRKRYLGFVIEDCDIEPGECLVFSPKVVKEDASVDKNGVRLKPYNDINMGRNVLSPHAVFGGDHFFQDLGHPGSIRLGSNSIGKTLSDTESRRFLRDVDFSTCFRYRYNGQTIDNMPFSLKKMNATSSVDPDHVVTTNQHAYPTLQIINGGAGGTQMRYFLGMNFFTNLNLSESYLENSDEDPEITFPVTFQIGAKQTWLDEQGFEGSTNSYRVRFSGGLPVSSIMFNTPPVAYGNVRPHLVTRSPAHFINRWWGNYTMGSWMISHASPSPNDVSEVPPFITRDGKIWFSKNPYNSVRDHDSIGRAVMFELPDVNYGSLSLGSLRHAHLSPYSWHPTYVIGNSLADLHAPADASAHLVMEDAYSSSYPGYEPLVTSSFDYWLGGVRTKTAGWSSVIDWGAETSRPVDSRSLLRLGSNATAKDVDGIRVSSEDENLTYDVSFEVNHNLFDMYFLSGMPLVQPSTDGFDWKPFDPLYNLTYTTNPHISMSEGEVEEALRDPVHGDGVGFWLNGYLTSANAQFNVNSTSVEAWAAVLSGMRDKTRESLTGEEIGGEGLHVLSRLRKPLKGYSYMDPKHDAGYAGARVLNDDEIFLLAQYIVKEVKERGPFLSLSDFVNRRLSYTGKSPPHDRSATPTGNDDVQSRYGVLESAIHHSGINQLMEIDAYDSSHDVSVKDSARPYNVNSIWKPDYKYRQVASKTWGLPGHVTQADLLTPLSPLISVRGESFAIRASGQSIVNEGGEDVVKATVYLEAVVIRTSEYVSPAAVSVSDTSIPDHTNRSTTPCIKVDQRTGEMIHNKLVTANARSGRRFRVLSFRWLHQDEI